MDENEYKNLIEAALFISGKPMNINEIASALGIISVGYLKNAADKLLDEYKNKNGSLIMVKIGDKYELTLKEPYASKVSSLAGSPDITKTSLKVLAYISKNEPIMQSSIIKAFGPSSYMHIKELTEKDFLTAKKAGRTKKLETTQKFKEYFKLE